MAKAVPAAALDRSASFCQMVVEGVRDYAIFALDPDGMIVSWNAGAERLTGYRAEDAVGRQYADLFSPGSGAVAGDPLEEARRAGRYEIERWWRTHDGGLVWVNELITDLSDSEIGASGFVVITRDLSDRQRADERHAAGKLLQDEAAEREHELRAELLGAERRAAYLAEASSILVASALSFDSTIQALARLTVSRLADWCIIFELDPQGQLVRRRVAHRDPRREQGMAALVGTTLAARAPHPLLSVLQTAQAEVLNELSPQLAASLVDVGDPANQPAAPPIERLMITPLLARGQVLGAVALIGSDPRHAFGDEDLALAEELGRRAAMAMDNARLYHEAQEANRVKADFLAIISHELRTPLNAIMGYSDLLDSEISGPMTNKQQRQISRIRASARHLLQLIEEILSFARLEDGGEEVRLERGPAIELAREAAAVIEPMAAAKGLAFNVEERGPPVVIETDMGKARQILVNLLSNAVKFTDAGDVSLEVTQDADSAVFRISDTGVGILPEKLSRIFEPFWQAERPNTRRVGGTGLGLSVSRRFARLLGGDIDVDSTPGGGTTFTVRLPLRREVPPVQPQSGSGSPGA